MSVTFHIPGPLRDFSQQRGEVQLSGHAATLQDALQLDPAYQPARELLAKLQQSR